MAAGSDLLDEVFFHTEVDEKVVSDLVGSLESELAGSGHANSQAKGQALANHVTGFGARGNTNVQESKVGLAQEVAEAGAGVQGGVINNTRSPGSAMDAATAGIASATDSEPLAGLSQSKTVAVSAIGTTVSNHATVRGKSGTSAVQTLNGSSVINSHSSGSVAAFAGTPEPASGGTENVASAVTVVNNGPGSAVRGGAVLPPASSTVIQTSFMNTQNIVTSTVITPQALALSTAPGVALVRPPMQAAGSATTQNGNNAVLTSGVSVAALPTPGIPSQSVTVSVTTGAQVIKSESPKTLPQGLVSSAGGLTLGQATQPAPIAKSPALQAVTRAPTPSSPAASPAGIRAIAPPVLAPRLSQAAPSQPNIQNIQLPPGMVLVRSDSGQLLMIHQQTLAQMQAQSQSQSAMAPRPATPTSTPPVHITSVQGPGTPILARQVTPTTIIKQASGVQASVQTTTTLQRPPVLQETMENVKKCKNFLSTLIKLASSGKQSSETAANVKDLVKNLLEGKIEAEDFTSRLYRELNSSPQPYLVPFLKRSLPALRAMTTDSAAFIQQSQLQQPAPASTTSLTTVVMSSAAQRPTTVTPASVATVTGTLQQPVISLAQAGHSKPGQAASLVLHQSQQQQTAMVRHPQVTITQTPMVTLRQPHSRIVLGQPQVQMKPLHTVPLVKSSASVGARGPTPPMAALSATQKNKLKDAGGGTFRDDDDINDVASMAGVNLSEENARILATNSELVGAVTRSCKDEAFLYTATLHRRVLNIGKKYGIAELGPEVVNFVSHATQQRLQDLLEKVSQIAQQKNFSFKDDSRYEQISDVRSQLKFFEQLDQMEKQRKEEQEREILMKAAKSRSRQEDPEQLRLKQKAKEMQQQELAQMRQREANLTALAAIGPRKKRKLDWPGTGAGAEGSGVSPSLSGATGTGSSRQFTRQRITRVNLRDLLFCLETERESSHSNLLYRAFLK
ncbi:transcription initiation factor TFIID subunit 4 isoform X2 [Paramormyrops kingsleyae]|uniref:transcription initiation factor TFIID subunit 4 isoform X2 n=1 Tax=Paramormyrops kingsleyae TaxID=1676925 RepID=UPI003B96BED2